MEGNLTKFAGEELQDRNNFLEMLVENSDQQDSEMKIPNKSAYELSQEEETLQIHLDKLRKENFTLRASIKAWQTTLKNKLDEFKEAELRLDYIHNEIWSERENFCSKVDKFNGAFGITSDWWATQMKFVSDLENLEMKSSEDQKCRQEIEKLEREMEELKKEINVIQGEKQIAVVEVHATEDEQNPENPSSVSEDDSTEERTGPTEKRLSQADERIEICEERRQPTEGDLYSLVDIEKVRMVNRSRNRSRKSHFLTVDDVNEVAIA